MTANTGMSCTSFSHQQRSFDCPLTGCLGEEIIQGTQKARANGVEFTNPFSHEQAVSEEDPLASRHQDVVVEPAQDRRMSKEWGMFIFMLGLASMFEGSVEFGEPFGDESSR